VSFRRHTFPEVLEGLLTDITGGVAAEQHPFPPEGSPPYRHNLLRPPAASIVSVRGSRDGQPHHFQQGKDYRLAEDQQALEWLEGATLPDAGTLVQVNYHPASAQPSSVDIHTGSVIRTLAESVALEMARLYAVMETVYRSGFIDTASGSALDNVVALLGVTRVRAGRAAGEVEFTRSQGSRGIITIPSGTRVSTSDGGVEYETTQTVTLAEGQNVVRAPARDLEEETGTLAADALTVLTKPIAGISRVTNPAPTAVATQDETDAELRTRAKNFLHGSERATLGAIKQAIAHQGVSAEVVESRTTPGLIEFTPHAESLTPEQMQRVMTAIEEVRPAGVLVVPRGVQVPRRVDLELRLTTAQGLLEQDLRAVQHQVRSKVEDYFARLPAKEPGSVNRIVGLALSVPEVQDIRIVSARWTVDGVAEDVLDREGGVLAIGGAPTVLGELHLADPSLPTRLIAVISYPQDTAAPPDAPAVQSALSTAVTYLNETNASELPGDASAAERARRTLSYGKLLHVVPLPTKPGASLEGYDDGVESGTAPALPDAAEASPYVVQFVVTLESGLSVTLSSGADEPPYTLTPFERLSLGGVEISRA
jgi:hypothetical protein